MFKLCRQSFCISQKSCFTFKTKTSLAKFDVDFFKQLTGTVPGDVPPRSCQLFQASRYRQFLHIAFARDVTKTVGRWIIVNHKHDDYASTALTLVNVTNTTRLYGDEIAKEILT